MRVKGNVSPVTLSMESYLPLEGYVEVRLRENIKEVTDIDPQTETSVTMFEYDEYTFLLKTVRACKRTSRTISAIGLSLAERLRSTKAQVSCRT